MSGWLQGASICKPTAVTFYLASGAHEVASARKGPFQMYNPAPYLPWPWHDWQIFDLDPPSLCVGGELLVSRIKLAHSVPFFNTVLALW